MVAVERDPMLESVYETVVDDKTTEKESTTRLYCLEVNAHCAPHDDGATYRYNYVHTQSKKLTQVNVIEEGLVNAVLNIGAEIEGVDAMDAIQSGKH